MMGLAHALSPQFLGIPVDNAISGEAELLRQAVGQTLADDTSVSFQSAIRPVEEVFRVIEEGTRSGKAIDSITVTQALALLDALPLWVTAPEVALEPDGQIGFDWVLGRRRMLSLNVGRNGMLGYSSLLGMESSYGRTPFAGELPERVLALLRLVSQEGQAG